ncbi:hypothetical protein A2773_00050 [Candidatus Gottesmanbacteria bacterium RIFCSPHIGHO2_01_FULL_39_10]|uniref:RNA-binding protein KhpA n=1 Tax=Candidatus Gottesmanbacteria bacterium RIFCSPHIGHO2_01_FULL_39_10 TaxID=1798375 RepID=A0A1F5ZML3_9BACT|nr:MAG: hypothetical protein A2773_00050 [Candidatus Gottesmanbacteria bacterium RIFCSPHIGHO2_01_FULL_39_10]
MKEFLEYIVKKLTDNPDKVVIEESTVDNQLILTLKIDKNDMGKVIGKEGKIISALRNLVKVAGMKEGKQIRVELLEA